MVARGKIEITLPDGSSREVGCGMTLREIAKGIGARLASDAIAGKIDGRAVDLSTAVESSARVEILTADSKDGIEIYRHSSSHIMAYAVKNLFPEAKVAIGPTIEDGFYYDFDVKDPFRPEDMERIEAEMARIIEADQPFERREVAREEALEFFKSRNEGYKVDIINEIGEADTISIYKVGDFTDLCRGPHVPSSGRIKAYKLTGAAGAYWRGDERNPMLQRLYGTAFPDRGGLEAHLERIEEAKRRDHRRLGRELDLYGVSEAVGPGLILWHPKGARVRRVIEDFWYDAHDRAGYLLVNTPHIARAGLWEASGHREFYKEYMYSPMDVDGIEYLVKPMNCPFHIQIYESHLRSYRDLPLRYAEMGTVYRYERSGVLHGLMRVRGFTMDDAHLFCRIDQIEEEVRSVLHLALYMLRAFGFEDYGVSLSTRPASYVGSIENWDRATAALEDALRGLGLPYEIDPGAGAFYGPKIDLEIKDSLGRAWQCATVQVDFNFPDRFNLSYIGEDGKRHCPIMIHRALLGSLERFFGILIEHYAGAFPLWLAPVQARVCAIAERHADAAEQAAQALRQEGIRAEVDRRNEKLGYKIREAEVSKIPVILVIGDREAEQSTASVRRRGMKKQETMTLDRLVAQLRIEGRPPKWEEPASQAGQGADGPAGAV